MKLRKLLVVLTVPGMIFSASGNAANYASGGKIYEAQVLSANPIYRAVQINIPIEQCWQEAVPASRHRSHTGEIFGALVGAAVGYQFGKGRGKDAATVAGAVLGASVGHDQSHRNRAHTRETRYQQRCKVVDQYHSEERLEGYQVTYQYNGQVYTTRTRHDPGSTIRVSVNVVPVK